jgi:hypothetical protein
MPSWIPRLKYELLIEPERITFANRDVRVEVEPRVWVREDGRILGVGTRPLDKSGRAIEVFGPAASAEAPRFDARFDALVQLFRHLMRVAQKAAVITLRPHVRVHGAASLRSLLNGREEQFVRDALLHAGAAKVEFAA